MMLKQVPMHGCILCRICKKHCGICHKCPRKASNGRYGSLDGFKLIFGSSENFPADWDDALFNFINRREQSAFTVDFLGRHITFIIDSRERVVGKGEGHRVLLTLLYPDKSSDVWRKL